jgi:hypothetical protein
MKLCASCSKELLDTAVFCGGCGIKQETDISNISRNTNKRVKNTYVAEGDVLIYKDESQEGDWFFNSHSLEAGANEAFRLTGVKFGIYVANNINGISEPSDNELEIFTNELYTEWFADSSGHLLLTLIDNGAGDFISHVIIGSAASMVFDREAIDVLLSYLDYNWKLADPNNVTPISESEMFGNTLSSTAVRIMNTS